MPPKSFKLVGNTAVLLRLKKMNLPSPKRETGPKAFFILVGKTIETSLP